MRGFGEMYDLIQGRFDKMIKSQRRGWARLDASDWDELAEMAFVLCEADEVDRCRVALYAPDDLPEEALDLESLADEFSDGTHKGIFAATRRVRVDGKECEAFWGPEEVANRFYEKAVSLGYKGLIQKYGADSWRTWSGGRW